MIEKSEKKPPQSGGLTAVAFVSLAFVRFRTCEFPASIYRRHRSRPKESNPWITGFLTPVCTVRCDSLKTPTVARVGASIIRQWDDPLQALEWMSKTFWPDEGRWIGFISYDLGRLFEKLPARAVDDLGLPLFVFTYCRPAGDRPPGADADYGSNEAELTSDFSRSQYESAVRRALEYIRAGDVFQVNLAQRFVTGLEAPSGGNLSAAGSAVAGGVRGVSGV